MLVSVDTGAVLSFLYEYSSLPRVGIVEGTAVLAEDEHDDVVGIKKHQMC